MFKRNSSYKPPASPRSTSEGIRPPLSAFDQILQKIDEKNPRTQEFIYRVQGGLTREELLVIQKVVKEDFQLEREDARQRRFATLLAQVIEGKLRTNVDIVNAGTYVGITKMQLSELQAVLGKVTALKSLKTEVTRFSEILEQIYNKNPSVAKNIQNAPSVRKITPQQGQELRAIKQRVDMVGESDKEAQRFLRLLTQICTIPQKYQAEQALKKSPITGQERMDLAGLLGDIKGTPRQFQDRLASYYKAGSFTALSREVSQIPIRGPEDIAFRSKLQSILERVQQYRTTYTARVKLLEALGNGNAETAQRILPELPNTTAQDLAFLKIFTAETLQVRRDQIKRRVVNLLARDSTDFNTVFTIIASLQSTVDGDQSFIAELTNTARIIQVKTAELNIYAAIAAFDANISVASLLVQQLPTRSAEEFQIKQALKERLRILQRERSVLLLRQAFRSDSADTILTRIRQLPEDDQDDIAIKQTLLMEFKEFIRVRRNLRPEDYVRLFSTEIQVLLNEAIPNGFPPEKLGINREAFSYVKERFFDSLCALFLSYRSDPQTRATIESIISQRSSINEELPYRRRVRDLRKQRQLSPVEENYYASTELLTAINPYLVAVALADFGTTSVYLQNYFTDLSNKTIQGLNDGDYIPQILVGTGPNGVIALGEIVRKNPELARDTLVIDQGMQPGGPFAIPNGPAWELNSANLIGKKELPDLPEKDEEKTVRAFGSSDRWYPGERTKESSDTRSGSINKLIDWLLDPDTLSKKRYPTNEELQIVLALQLAVCTNQLLLRTELLDVTDDPRIVDGKIVTLYVTTPTTSRIIKLTTSNLIICTGIGESFYGFNTKGKKAESVIAFSQKQQGLPKVSTTLEAFRALADRTRIKPTVGLGEVVAIYGIGNSADVLVEYLGRLFDGENLDVRKVKKIYVIATGAPTRRPRYRKIDDIRPRLGQRGNLITPISNRVGDFSFVNKVPSAEGKLVLFDTNNRMIRDDEGNIIEVDNIIAATGFQPTLDRVFQRYRSKGRTQFPSRLIPFTIPTNSKLTVGATLAEDPTVLFVGTAAPASFDETKLAQLPPGARAALINVGTENAVAIGFRGPETQAAINLYTDKITYKRRKAQKKPAIFPIPIIERTAEVAFTSPCKAESNKGRTQDNADITRVLSTILAYILRNAYAYGLGRQPFTGEIQLKIQYDPQKNTLSLSSSQNVSSKYTPDINTVLAIGKILLENSYIQNYGLAKLNRTRGRNPAININIGFQNGKLDIANTYVL